MSRRSAFALTLALAGTFAAGAAARAQAPTPPGQMPAVGQMAPDFTLPAATRYGVLEKPVTLSDLKGKTVVLAFFFEVRTKG